MSTAFISIHCVVLFPNATTIHLPSQVSVAQISSILGLTNVLFTRINRNLFNLTTLVGVHEANISNEVIQQSNKNTYLIKRLKPQQLPQGHIKSHTYHTECAKMQQMNKSHGSDG
eukprot:1011303_1